MRHTIFATLGALLFATATYAANGDLLERTPISEAGAAVTVEQVLYESDGLRIAGFLAYPAAAPASNDKLPCIVFNRGGNRDFGAISSERALRMGPQIAGVGYVWFASNYRGAPGSEGQDEFGGSDVNDILNGIEALKHLEFVDSDRIGMWGHSRGGMMTYLALKRGARVRAAVVGAGMADMARSCTDRPEMETNVFSECIPGWKEDREAAIASRSAVRWADQLPKDVPILLLHGTADWRVNPKDALDMAMRLYEVQHPYRLIMFEGTDHGLTEVCDQEIAAIRDWFDRYVRDGAPLPDLKPHGR